MKNVKSLLLNLLFPKICIICEKEGKYLCKDCFNSIPIKKDFCPICKKKETFAGSMCNYCIVRNRKKGLNGIMTVTNNNPLIQKCLSYFKNITEISIPLSKLLIKKINSQNFPINDFKVIPLPNDKYAKIIYTKIQKEFKNTGKNILLISVSKTKSLEDYAKKLKSTGVKIVWGITII